MFTNSMDTLLIWLNAVISAKRLRKPLRQFLLFSPFRESNLLFSWKKSSNDSPVSRPVSPSAPLSIWLCGHLLPLSVPSANCAPLRFSVPSVTTKVIWSFCQSPVLSYFPVRVCCNASTLPFPIDPSMGNFSSSNRKVPTLAHEESIG